MEEVNMTLGRFQPFTKGHLQMVIDGKDKNGLSTVILMIQNNKPDARHPFSDDLIKKELDVVKKNNPNLIEDIILVPNADIIKNGQLLSQHGYKAHLWLCGDDREAQYKRMTSNPKYRSEGGYPDDFTTYTGTGRVEGVSGTAVREAIKSGEKEAFKKLMPKGTDKLFKEFQEEMETVKESYKGLSEYLIEAVASRKTGKYTEKIPDDPTTWEVGDILCGTAGYSMCLPRWYKIVKRTAKKITCIRLEGKIISGHKNGQWQELPTDQPSRYESGEISGMINKWGRLKIDDTLVHLWDGKTPLYGDDQD